MNEEEKKEQDVSRNDNSEVIKEITENIRNGIIND